MTSTCIPQTLPYVVWETLGNPHPLSPILSVFTLELREQLLAVVKFGRLDGAANVVGTSRGKAELLGQP